MDNNSNDTRVASVLHRAHLRFQRDALRLASLDERGRDARSACPEQRSCHFEHFMQEWLIKQRAAQLNAVLTGLRPNFWRSYLNTIVFMSK